MSRQQGIRASGPGVAGRFRLSGHWPGGQNRRTHLGKRAALLLAVVFALGCAAARAGPLSGKVTGPEGAPVAGANVFISGPIATGRLVLRTDAVGQFQLRNLPVGTFRIEVLAEGFFPAVHEFEMGSDPVLIELTLVPKEVKQALDVVESISAIDPQETARIRLLSEDQIEKVPFSPAYDFRKALATLPGVSLDREGRVHVNGGATDQTLYLLDGFNLTNPVTGGLDNSVNLDAIHAADVRSSRYSAEYGKASAGVISVSTRSGDDRFRQQVTDFLPSFDHIKGIGTFLKDWAPRFVVSGPILKGRFWFLNSADTKYDLNVLPDLPPGGNRSRMWRWSDIVRLQVQLGPSHLLSATFFMNGVNGQHIGLDLQSPVETTLDLSGANAFASVKDQRYWHGILSEIGFSVNRLDLRRDPMGQDLFILQPGQRQGNFFLRSHRRAERDEWLVQLMAPPLDAAGRHELKFGTTFDRVLYWETISRQPYETRLVQGVPWRRTYFTGGSRFRQNNLEWSGYVQDRWTPVERVLLEFGARADWDRIVGRARFSPRLAFSAVPWAGKEIKLSAGVGVFYDATNLSAIGRTLDQSQYDVFYRPDGAIDSGPLVTLFRLPATPLRAPRVVNWSTGWEQKLRLGVSLRAAYIQRNGPSGFTFRNLLPAPTASEYALYGLQNSRHDRYRALEVTVSHSLFERAQWTASYTRSSAWSNAVLDYTVDNPFFAGQGAGPMNWDTPNRLLANGWLRFREQWVFSSLIEWRDGMPYSLVNDRQELVGLPNSSRFARYFSLNAHLERTVRLGGHRWALRGGINNITGRDNFTLVDNNLNSPNFLKFGGAARRTFTFRLRYLGRS